MLLTLAEVLGPCAVAAAKAAASMDRTARVYSALILRMNTRLEAGRVGTQNPTEAEIQRRQVTRIGPERGLVGTQNPTEAEIQRRQVTRIGAEAGLVGVQNATERRINAQMMGLNLLVGEALRGVGANNRTQADIYWRLACAYATPLPSAPRGAGALR